MDQALRLITSLQQANAESKNSALLFLDIKKAFDRIDHHRLAQELLEVGVPRHIVSLILNIMQGNRITVLLKGSISDGYTPDDGLPQGGILSPLLFIFYIRNLPSRHSQLFAFADDVAMCVTTPRWENPATKLSEDYALVRSFFSEKRIQLSDTKIRSMFMLNSRKRFRNLTIEADGHQVTPCSEYKYLGVWIDHCLNFAKFTTEVVHNLRNRINVIRRISSCVRLSRKVIENFYTAYVRGYLNYLSPLLPALAPYLMTRIEQADRHGLRLCIGALPGTRITEIHSESTIPPMALFMKTRILQYGARLIFRPEMASLLDLFLHKDRSPLVRSWHELWEYYAIPTAPNIAAALSIIRYRVRHPKHPWKYHHHWFWKERTLARIRMGCTPTRVWAYKVGLAASPLCRHCASAEETWSHLFRECPSLDQSFALYWDLNYDLPFSEDNVRDTLKKKSPKLRALEDNICRFIEVNHVFKR